MLEIWRDIKDYEGLYQVSNLGRVKSLERLIKKRNGFRRIPETVLTTIKTEKGYLRVGLWKNGKCKKHSVHRLVGIMFSDMVEWTESAKNRPFEELEINHKNEFDKTNNCVINLQWCTNEDNLFYGTRIDRITEKLTNHPNTSKSIIQYTLDNQFVAEYPSIAEAYRQTGILSSYICKNLKGYEKYPSAGGFKWVYKTTQT